MSCERCEELRTRAEWAESRIASVSGVTREQLAAREYERGFAEGKTLRDELVAVLKRVGCQDAGSCGPDEVDGRCFVCSAIAKAGGAR